MFHRRVKELIILYYPLFSHHTAPYSGAAGAVVLGEPRSAELQREDVWDAGLPQQRVEERL